MRPVRVSLLTALLLVGCAPTRRELSQRVAADLPSGLQRPARWLGADDDKDRAVNDAVASLLSRPITPDEAAEIALVRHRRVQVAYESLGLAQADLVDAGLLSNPRLGLSLHVHPDGPPQPPGLDVDVDLPFLSVLFLAQRISIAEARADAARVRVIDEVIDTAAEARRAAVRAAATAEISRLMRADVEAAEGSVVLVRENTKAGNMTPLDLAEEELRYQQAILMAADAERDATLAHDALKSALGLFGGEARVKVTSLAALPPLPVPGTDVVIDSDGLERVAVERSLRLVAVTRELDAAARELGYASIVRFMPDLSIGVAVELDAGEQTVGPGASVGVPIFNLGQGELLRRESALRRRAAELQRDAVELRALARQTAVSAELARRRAHQIQTRVMPQQLVVVDELERRLNGMIVFPTRLFEGRRSFVQARRQEVAALRDAWLMSIDVEQLRQGGTPTAPMTTTTPGTAPRSMSAPQAQAHGGH